MKIRRNQCKKCGSLTYIKSHKGRPYALPQCTKCDGATLNSISNVNNKIDYTPKVDYNRLQR